MPIRSARLEEERSGWLAVILPALSSHHHRRLSTLNARLRSPTPCLVLLCLWPITVHMPFWATWRSPTAMANGGKSTRVYVAVATTRVANSFYRLLSQPQQAGRSVWRSTTTSACWRRSHHTTHCSGRNSARDVCSLSSGRMSGTRMLFLHSLFPLGQCVHQTFELIRGSVLASNHR